MPSLEPSGAPDSRAPSAPAATDNATLPLASAISLVQVRGIAVYATRSRRGSSVEVGLLLLGLPRRQQKTSCTLRVAQAREADARQLVEAARPRARVRSHFGDARSRRRKPHEALHAPGRAGAPSRKLRLIGGGADTL